MTLTFAIEASQPNGRVYRLAIGGSIFSLVSWCSVIIERLF